MSFIKKSFTYFCDNIQWEDLIDYMEDNNIQSEHVALERMYEEYELSFYELRGCFDA